MRRMLFTSRDRQQNWTVSPYLISSSPISSLARFAVPRRACLDAVSLSPHCCMYTVLLYGWHTIIIMRHKRAINGRRAVELFTNSVWISGMPNINILNACAAEYRTLPIKIISQMQKSGKEQFQTVTLCTEIVCFRPTFLSSKVDALSFTLIVVSYKTNRPIYLRQGGYIFVVVCMSVC